MAKIWLSIPIYTLFLSASCMLILSCFGLHYFSQDFLIIDAQINYKVLFGCGIGASVIFFVGIWFFLMVPRFICNYFVTFPALIVVVCVYISFLVPNSLDNYLSKWDEKWEDDIEEQNLQIKLNCCGWNNYTDRSIDNCPFNADSGCKTYIENYLEKIFNVLLILASLTLALGVVSTAFLILACSLFGEDDLLAHFDSA